MKFKSRLLTRRNFLKAATLVAGADGLCRVVPNLIINPVYAGTAVIIDSSGDKILEMANASFARAFDIGTWSSLRVGMRLTINGSASLTSLTPRFVVGACSGSSAQVFDSPTTNFIGTRSGDETWAFVDTTNDYYWMDDGFGESSGYGLKYCKKVATTWTDGGNITQPSSNNTLKIMRSNTGFWGMYMVEITKGSPNWSVRPFCMKEAAPGVLTAAVARDSFLAQMVAVSPSLSHHVWCDAATIAFDEVAGAINHVQVGWDRTEATIQITDLAVAKMAA